MKVPIDHSNSFFSWGEGKKLGLAITEVINGNKLREAGLIFDIWYCSVIFPLTAGKARADFCCS